MDPRYCRQIAVLGPKHIKLRKSTVAIVGCGGLGCVLASSLVRAGVNIVLIDDDSIEESNLSRQVLFENSDTGKLKVVKATARLREMNDTVHIEPFIARLTADNAAVLLKDVSVIADCSDNMETRFVINQYCLDAKKPWVYGAVQETEGKVWPIVPGLTPCLECVLDNKYDLSSRQSVGVLGVAVGVVGHFQATEVIKLLIGDFASLKGCLAIDVWSASVQSLNFKRQPTCKCHDIQTRPT